MTSSAHHSVAKDFSAKTRRALASKGVTVIGSQLLPGDGDMPWANAIQGYLVDDNGEGRVLTFSGVLKRAEV